MRKKLNALRRPLHDGPDLMLWSGGIYLALAIGLAVVHVDVTSFVASELLLPDGAFARFEAINPALDYLPSLYFCMLALLPLTAGGFVLHAYRRRTFLMRTESTGKLLALAASSFVLAMLPPLLLAFGYRDASESISVKSRGLIALTTANDVTIAIAFFLLFAFSAFMVMAVYICMVKLQMEPLWKRRGFHGWNP